MLTFLSNKEIYEKVICELVPQARKRLWIATADIKDMYVAMPGSDKMIPFLQLLDSLLERGVAIRLIHYRGRLRDIGYTTDKNGNRVKKPESFFTRQEREDAFVQFLYPSPRDVFRVEIHGVEDFLKVYEEAAKPVDLSAILQRKKTP